MQPQPTDRTVRKILDDLAEADKSDENVVRGFAPPRIRSLAKMAEEIADEHGIAQPGPTPSEGSRKLAEQSIALKDYGEASNALVPYVEPEPIRRLADTLSRFTFGDMMTVAKELKQQEHATFESPENIAALLHAWATKTLQK